MTNMKKIKEKQSEGIYVKKDLIERLMQFYLTPEIRKRKFRKIQLIFRLEESEPEILFDENAKKVDYMAPVKEGVTKQEGEEVYLNELAGDPKNVTIKREENSLHATFIKINENTYLPLTNYLFNREYIGKLVTVSQEFLNSAETNFTKNQWYPFIDNLFSAYELLMKIFLVSLPYIESLKEIKPLVKGKISHERITREGSKLRYSGIISENRFKVLTQLKDLRWNARYLSKDLSLTEAEVMKFLDETSDFLKFMKKIIES